MNVQYSVLIFSRYSSNCKKLTDMITGSGVDFSPLQQLCIDNAQVRARIKANKQLDISIVPCILSVYPNGVVEKYEAEHAFSWVEDIIKRFAPPPPPPRPVVQAPRPVVVQPPPEVEQEDSPPPKRRMVPVKPATSISDIPFDEDGDEDDTEEDDRHRLPKMPKRIRSNENSFIEDEELFQGETVDDRKPPSRKSLKATTKQKEENSIMLKAKEMATSRGVDEHQMNPMSKRPVDSRVP
jgi:hypothetical protein